MQGEEMRENGEETSHNVTVSSSSIGDITIDSVKDHLGSGDEISSRLSGITIIKTVAMTAATNESGETVTSHTTTVTSTTNNDEGKWLFVRMTSAFDRVCVLFEI